MKSTIGERIKYRRSKIGMTLLQEAEALGVAEATAQRYESGKIKTLKYETIVKLSEILKCTPGYLMGWEDVTWPAQKYETLDTKKEIELLIDKLSSQANLTFGESHLSDAATSMLKNSLESLILNMELILKK